MDKEFSMFSKLPISSAYSVSESTDSSSIVDGNNVLFEVYKFDVFVFTFVVVVVVVVVVAAVVAAVAAVVGGTVVKFVFFEMELEIVDVLI